MWLSENKRNEGKCTEAAVCLVGNDTAEVLMPAGILRIPKQSDRQLKIFGTDGCEVLLGTVGSGSDDELEEGEICIMTDNAKITVKNNGAVNINGTVNIVGSLKLNGVSL